MAGKAAKGTNRLENDIFKCRDESNWKKIQELAEQLMQRGTGPQSEAMASFFIGESKLEQFLEEHPPTEANINKAKTGLTEAKRYLNNCFTEHGAKASPLFFPLLACAFNRTSRPARADALCVV
ncbi:hypothetical protein HPB51_006812 [Rhipicephalus microplus]|uniref:Tetratricopeptide repeat protein 7 N-terminal domain-containing protein n=1 Tax=Rhipicephalus microplus TaxID=6941 RepID=A0A9J6E851_RHIMP|nr:hypothetical protein HPB51_006812 [Rhipicephalus microplus]